MVFVQTGLGHFPWPAREADEGKTPEEKIEIIVRDLDSLFTKFLAELDEAGLGEEVIVVVTGDHGFRLKGEFDSLKIRLAFRDVAFNVPLLIYAPGLLSEQRPLTSLSSHIDLAPTLLDMVGISNDGLLRHGMSVLDERLDSRVTFMLSDSTVPINGYHWQGYYFTVNDLTSAATLSRDFTWPHETSLAEGLQRYKDIPETLSRAHDMILDGKKMIISTHSYLENQSKEADGPEETVSLE